jgi:hypothetical protein
MTPTGAVSPSAGIDIDDGTALTTNGIGVPGSGATATPDVRVSDVGDA